MSTTYLKEQEKDKEQRVHYLFHANVGLIWRFSIFCRKKRETKMKHYFTETISRPYSITISDVFLFSRIQCYTEGCWYTTKSVWRTWLTNKGTRLHTIIGKIEQNVQTAIIVEYLKKIWSSRQNFSCTNGKTFWNQISTHAHTIGWRKLQPIDYVNCVLRNSFICLTIKTLDA